MTTSLPPVFPFRGFNSAGLPLVGGLLWSYAAGTSVPLATFSDSSGVTPNTNPVVLDANGEANVWLGPYSYKFVLETAATPPSHGAVMWTRDNVTDPRTLLLSELANTSDAAFGDALVGVRSPLTGGTARTQHTKNQDIVSVKDFGVVGDGVTDDTGALAAAVLGASGKTLNFLDELTILVSSTITLVTNSRYVGRSVIKAKNLSSIAGALLTVPASATKVVIDGLRIDGNAASTGANYGIQLSLGTQNTVRDCYIHDTIQAGIRAESETDLVISGNRVINCGRSGFTDNHGIMVYSTTATATSGCIISGNHVSGSYRKGIAVYAATPGSASNILIDTNYVSGSGAGGIYVAPETSAATISNITIVGNHLNNNYANVVLGLCQNSCVVGNTLRLSTTAQGMVVEDCTGINISGNTIVSSRTTGLQLSRTSGSSQRNSVTGNVIIDSNQSSAAFGPGIHLSNTSATLVTGNSVIGESSSPKQTHAVVEDGTSDYNVIFGNQLINTSSGFLISFVGANTAVQNVVGSTLVIGASAGNANALIDMVSTTKAVMLPRMTEAQRNAIPAPTLGMVIVNTTTGKLNIRGAAAWEAVTSV